jgi:hypothetical protein
MDPIGVVSRSSNRAVDSFHKTSIVIGDAVDDDGDEEDDGAEDRLLKVSCLSLPSDFDENILDKELKESRLSIIRRLSC